MGVWGRCGEGLSVPMTPGGLPGSLDMGNSLAVWPDTPVGGSEAAPIRNHAVSPTTVHTASTARRWGLEGPGSAQPSPAHQPACPPAHLSAQASLLFFRYVLTLWGFDLEWGCPGYTGLTAHAPCFSPTGLLGSQGHLSRLARFQRLCHPFRRGDGVEEEARSP